jgi:murein DD-endopeptidase MepM/ murein hydrolase activator NlpD
MIQVLPDSHAAHGNQVKLTYDGHHGTDFRLRDLVAMRNKVAVVAVAPGTVLNIRDGEQDLNVKLRDKNSLKGKEAGNGVRIDHGEGWTTQYSHLLKGTVSVRKGQRVNTGDVLGMVAFSAIPSFPMSISASARMDNRLTRSAWSRRPAGLPPRLSGPLPS